MKRVNKRDKFLDNIEDQDDILMLNKEINHLQIDENEEENDVS
tara:strand:+ start:2162 stop:2290 length:129 start_codon:yes stop_codon:yes gene_type:complete